jgi:hypothetical protein
VIGALRRAVEQQDSDILHELTNTVLGVLLAFITECYVQGVSTMNVGRLARTLKIEEILNS